MKSYFSDRYPYILIAGCKSAASQLSFGVPRGFVLGAKMYGMNTNPLREIIKRHDFKYHCYADETLVYMTLKRGDNMDKAKIV